MLHEREADAQGLRLVYSLFDFAELELSEDDLPRMLNALQLTGFSGVNVTHPYKQTVMRHLDELSSEAEKIGAVNAVSFRGGRTTGYNTDVSGFAAACRQGLDGVESDEVVQIGAGGAGSATAFALLNLGVKRLSIHDRDEQRATALIDRLVTHFDSGRLALCRNLPESAANADGIVNATPMGMAEYPGMPVPERSLHQKMWVADIVYFPLETALLSAARRTGCRVMDGSGMAVWQAAGAFEIFTGRPADFTRMSKIFLQSS
jgi:shikimate dehydrogenase